jgi:hypothetical protein
MDYKNFIITILIIVVPLILMVLCYRNYVYQYCENDMKCIKDRLLFNINNQKKKLYESYKNEQAENSEEQLVEGFFGNMGSWFSGSVPTNLPVSSPTDISILEKKISDKALKSSTFPPEPSKDDNGDFKDADNAEILNIGSSPYNPPKPQPSNPVPNQKPSEIVSIKNEIKQPNIAKLPEEQKKTEVKIEKPSLNSLFGKCQFYNDKCPEKYKELGNFSIEGVGSNSVLKCGNVQDTKPAKAVALIKNNNVYEIHVIDSGKGFNPINPPKITIEGGKGNGATAEGIVDDDGNLKIIKVINPGYNYTETPNVMIDAPFMNSSCHLCCDMA